MTFKPSVLDRDLIVNPQTIMFATADTQNKLTWNVVEINLDINRQEFWIADTTLDRAMEVLLEDVIPF